MKLSIIVSSYKQSKGLKWFLKDLEKQTSQSFEVILFIDRPSNSDLTLVDQYSQQFGQQIKWFINSSSKGNHSNWLKSIDLVSGDYIIFLTPETYLKNDFVEKFEYYSKFNTDIIEYKPELKGVVKWTPKARLHANTTLELKNYKAIIAYSFPFIFNKFIKYEVIKNVSDFTSSKFDNTRFWVHFVYKVLANIKNYTFVDEVLATDYVKNLSSFNINLYINEWKEILDLYQKNHKNYNMEIEYAKMFFFHIFLSGFIGMACYSKIKSILGLQSKNKKRLEKLKNTMKIIRGPDFKNFVVTNKYLLASNEESFFLINFDTATKWHLIFSKF
ncbi:glycosyltransferase family 2 protein [Mycoplasma iguanae]|uniref:Glycosyltransferase family 2 protein n=1 Tax=Mycoplasma iguanae TaxID=292461 RepID=A0ABY5R8N1_9MOLU|nr:glycosyltransferase family 2 protein [Mycoplasma iguanae]UVD81671.1 glycosyltransferase family 2 protein [Mycoplasma iguanae]